MTPKNKKQPIQSQLNASNEKWEDYYNFCVLNGMPKKKAEELMKSFQALLQEQSESFKKMVEEKILDLIPECKHDVFLTNDMIFKGFLKDLDISQVQICKFNEFEFADKLSDILNKLK